MKVYIRTYGCQMNVYDSERIAGALAPAGYAEADAPEDADLILLNTCHIREKAAEKVYSELGRLRPLKAAKPGLKVAVAGCVAQAEGEEIRRRAPLVDLVVGPQAYHRLPAMLTGDQPPVLTDFPAEDKFDHLAPRPTRRAPAAFLTVQEGCDKFCTFCVVPYTRGAEVSRPVAQILREARDLVARGVAEVTLLGQNVNAYHGQGEDGTWSLARLVRALADIPGLVRIRYTTSHPNDMTDDLIAAHADVGALMPYLHLPVQAGSDRILKAMNRAHSVDAYRRVVERVRTARPDIAISGDFIVGFPTETDAEFAATLRLAAEIGYASAFSFKYSPRPGTPAALRDQVPEDVKAARLQALQAQLSSDQAAFNADCVGRTLPVLFEKPGREPGQVVGRSPYLQNVVVQAPSHRIGQTADVRIDKALPNALAGALV